MKELQRPPAPAWLKKKYKVWGRKWEQIYARTHDAKKFRWYQYQKHGYADLVEKLATMMTQWHCSFCDAYPMGSRIRYTIEHFRPKTKYPRLAYTWGNLFLCCDTCQQKSDQFDKKLLKPDQHGYAFDNYFEINWATGELRPSQMANAKDQERARITISFYHLNDDGKPEDRLEEAEKYLDAYNPNNPNINKWAYRFFIERLSN